MDSFGDDAARHRCGKTLNAVLAGLHLKQTAWGQVGEIYKRGSLNRFFHRHRPNFESRRQSQDHPTDITRALGFFFSPSRPSHQHISQRSSFNLVQTKHAFFNLEHPHSRRLLPHTILGRPHHTSNTWNRSNGQPSRFQQHAPLDSRRKRPHHHHPPRPHLLRPRPNNL